MVFYTNSLILVPLPPLAPEVFAIEIKDKISIHEFDINIDY